MMVSRLPEQDGECPARPELDVAAFPQGAQVIIHFVGQGDGEVLQVAVVGRGDDELASAAGFEDAADEQYECPRLVEVFDDFHRNHCFEGNAAQFGREFARGYITDEKPVRISPSLHPVGDRYALFGCVDAVDAIAFPSQVIGEVTVSAAYIQNRRTVRGQ